MEARQRVRDLLDRLPEDCSLEDVLYSLYVVRSIEKGLEDADSGRVASHAEVTEGLVRKWRVADSSDSAIQG